jgi:type I restriction enzyme S subunit
MSSVVPSVRLGAVIRPLSRAESPVPGKLYRQIGVRLWGEGAYERETIDGGSTKYAQLYRAEVGDVIVNKIWARNGSIGVVSEALAGTYGSGEFPMFAPSWDRVDPRWIHWLTKTRGFWAQCDEKSRGTSGQNRIRPERFLEIEIPLPQLSEQQRILTRIDELAAQIDKAISLRQRAVDEAKALPHSSSEERFDELAKKVSTQRLSDVCSSITDG